MPVSILIVAACLSVPPAIVGTRRGTEAITDSLNAAPEKPLVPDKFGFMQWQWVEPSARGRGASGRIEHARAKFVGVKDSVVTIKTDTGQTVKIPWDRVGRQQRKWLDAELEKQDAKKAKKLQPDK
jgi:hypothetical protein